MAEYQLSDKHRDWLRHDNRLPEARAFREGLEVEALTRKADIPDHLRDIHEYVTTICRVAPERTPEQIATSLYYIFHTPTRWERIKERINRAGNKNRPRRTRGEPSSADHPG